MARHRGGDAGRLRRRRRAVVPGKTDSLYCGVSRRRISGPLPPLVAIVAEPEMRNYLTGQGVDPVTNTPEQFAAHIKSEVPKFAKIAKAAGITPE